ncbi:MAG: hypothetical protein GY767_19825 [Shimia sp.]|nr:hypothetical protein [Shimia sp.]MCP4827081.1 hypothetical protein [Shimia sp.]
MNRLVNTTAALCVMAGAATAGNPYSDTLTSLVDSTISGWVTDPTLVAAIIAQNAETASYSDDQVAELDTLWQSGSSEGRQFIDGVWHNALSEQLKGYKSQSPQLFSEIFVVDGRGLNVGQSNITSDYFQGDEAKWQVPHDTGEIHFGEVEFDESSQTYLSQVSAPIIHEGEFIGTITVGVNVEGL